MFIDTKEASGSVDLSVPSMKALAYALRHKEVWPEGFKWNYRVATKCAIGLAAQLWDAPELFGWGLAGRASKYFGISYETANDIFLSGAFGVWQFFLGRVTPEMVADQIDAYLAAR